MNMQKARADFFSDVYQKNLWGSAQSRSGEGSELGWTSDLVEKLPILLRTHGVRCLLDVPCGDFHWMQAIDLEGVEYIGGDIVPQIVVANQERHGSASRRFIELDIVADALPSADMIFVRDCFIHFDNALVFEALHNIARSSIRYLCMTHDLNAARYPNGQNIELDRAKAGVNFEYRPIHFELPPYSFPPPAAAVKDGDHWAMSGGVKTMAVWDMAAVRATLSAR
ncbi:MULTISPECIES: class I SAM-dependent methyltransferase [Ralstonia]|nr:MULTISPECIES: class I SAM-dependent methyltransferase [Ralstonia]